MRCASLGYDTADLAHLPSAFAERGGTASRQETGAAPGQSWYRSAAKLGRAALKANARRFAANMRPIIDEIMRAGGFEPHRRQRFVGTAGPISAASRGVFQPDIEMSWARMSPSFCRPTGTLAARGSISEFLFK
jgi:hypothetical protein